MNKNTGILLVTMLAFAISLPLSSVAVAEEDATKEMAEIVMDINHRPDADAKEKLREISMSGSEAEKTIANALIEMDHKVKPEAKEKLQMISKDSSVPENTRELAGIVADFHHQASSDAKKKLKDIEM